MASFCFATTFVSMVYFVQQSHSYPSPDNGMSKFASRRSYTQASNFDIGATVAPDVQPNFRKFADAQRSLNDAQATKILDSAQVSKFPDRRANFPDDLSAGDLGASLESLAAKAQRRRIGSEDRGAKSLLIGCLHTAILLLAAVSSLVGLARAAMLALREELGGNSAAVERRGAKTSCGALLST
eukprot:TRINITY_DN55315_c0_g1_i1.p3 TRINITY_DN55315_c0_g1~~TRINITY_DN55315_c0_g1_i1.p3  ORF type:complete len:184 (-),score=44.45 TRINITY_DN55315_c0_g1_i1:241-792(-)